MPTLRAPCDPWSMLPSAVHHHTMRCPTRLSVPAVPATRELLAALLLLLLVPLAGLAAGCDDEPPRVLDVAIASDTLDGRGPFEIVVSVDHPDRVAGAVLWYRAGDGDEWNGVTLRRRDRRDDALVGAISPIGYRACTDCPPRESAWPLGTRIDYWLELESSSGATVREPLDAPLALHSFVIGAVDAGVAVLEVQPREGPASGGTRVFVYGAGLRADSQLFFGAARATEVTAISSALLIARTPPGPGGTFVDVSVRGPLGSSGHLDDAFFYIAPPTLERVDPAQGPTAGGTRVTLVGRDFDVLEVTFGGVPAPILSTSATSLVVETPPHAAGPVDVSVRNRDGQSGTLEDGFLYVPPPAPLQVVPAFGPARGGTVVEVLGEGFAAGAVVRFGGVATPCELRSPERFECVTVAQAAGVVDVEVSNPDGQSGLGRALYEYLDPPVVLAVVPARGPTTGGTAIEVRGRGFFPGALVELGPRAAANCVVLDRERIACQTPPSPTVGFVDVLVTNPDGQSGLLPGGFEYVLPPPELVSISPASGSDLGGTLVSLRVDGLQPGARIFLGGAECVVQTLDALAGIVTCITQPHAEGFVDVLVVNPDGQQDLVEDFYRYVGPPRILSIDPPRGLDTGGTTVTITGENFVAGMTVTFDGLEAVVLSVDEASGTVVVSTPAHPLGFVDVTVTNPDARSDTAPDGFEYVLAPPEITQLVPPEGPTWGGNPVTILGTNFRVGVVVRVGGVALAPGQYVRVDATRIEILAMPPGTGTVLVEVVNPDGQSAAASYTYVSITVSPSGGLSAGHTRVVVTGRGFVSGATVRFAGVPALSVSFVDATTLVAESPPGPLGAQDVAVALPDGRGEVVVGGFAYRRFVDVTASSALDAALDCQAARLVDIENDGDLDTIIGRGGLDASGTAFAPNTVQRNDGSGVFGPPTALSNGERTINLSVADFDADGDVDLLDINLDDTTRLFVNDGSGNFSVSSALPFAPTSIYDAKFLDHDLDGDLDLALLHIEGGDALLRQRPNHTYQSVDGQLPADTVTQGHDHDLSVGDIDGDGFPDLFAGVDNTLQFGGSLRFFGRSRLYRNDRMGGFTLDASQPFSLRNGDVLDSDLVDVDGDGDLDLLTSDNILPEVDPVTLPDGSARSGVLLWLNDGTGNFSAAHQRIAGFPLQVQGFNLTPADLDDDGDLDLLLSTAPDSSDLAFFGHEPSHLWVNDGAGNFHDASVSWTPLAEPTIAIEAGDLSGDGLDDLLFCNFTVANRLLVQRAQ